MLLNIKSNYILKKIIEHTQEKTYLNTFKYNKQIQKKLRLNIDDYKRYLLIDIEIILCDNLIVEQNTIFIHTVDDERLYHIYFDDSREELCRNYLIKGENPKKINVRIDYGIISLSKLFSDIQIIKEIKFLNFNTPIITDMSFMFYNCRSLTNLDIAKLTTKNVENMSCMFYNLIEIENLDISNFITNNVTDMSYMFYGCANLINLDFTKFNTEKVTNMMCLFSECKLLNNIDLSKFNTANVINMDYMFDKCEFFDFLDLKNFNTDNVVSMESMFSGCKRLKSLNISNFNTKNVKNMKKMFEGCKMLSQVDVDKNKFIINNDTNVENMSDQCSYDFNQFKSQNNINNNINK